MGKVVTKRYALSKRVRAPFQFVYEWCSQFHDDYDMLSGIRINERDILENTERRIIYTTPREGRKYASGEVFVIYPDPPNAWELESIGGKNQSSYSGYFHVTRIGKEEQEEVSQIDIIFNVRYKDPTKIPVKTEFLQDLGESWGKIVQGLEADYRSISTSNAKGK